MEAGGRQHGILCGRIEDILPTLHSQSFDACLCDPPYGLGFMGASWDDQVPAATSWMEIRRVLRPGAPLLAFGGSRTFHHLAVALEAAGLSIADTLLWLTGGGYPKSRKVGVDSWQGHGTALKPGWQPILLALRPRSATVRRNAELHGVGGLNIDGCRIAVGDAEYARNASGDRADGTSMRMGGGSVSSAGRWPANVILDQEAAALLDEQSGQLVSGANPRRRQSAKHRSAYGTFRGEEDCVAHRGSDSGGASRFFYCARVSRAERNLGGITCTHPTLKPLALTEWLAKLVLPPPMPDGSPRRLLVPFAGAGSEMIGALRAGWDEVLGIEADGEFVRQAEARIAEDRVDHGA